MKGDCSIRIEVAFVLMCHAMLSSIMCSAKTKILKCVLKKATETVVGMLNSHREGNGFRVRDWNGFYKKSGILPLPVCRSEATAPRHVSVL